MIESRSEKLIWLYHNAKIFFDEILPEELRGNEDELDKYFTVPEKYQTKSDILYGLLSSLQNRQMSTKVIALKDKDNVEKFDRLFFQYDIDSILKTYTADSLLECFKKNFEINNVESKNNLWRIYAKSVISACEFLSRFDRVEDFDEFVNHFDYNEFSRAALPMLLAKEIFGLGFPLACDFLKELGYMGYPKPDVHIKDILYAFDLCDNDNYSAYKTVIEMAIAVDETPYKVDKILWLIGSGEFHEHKISIGRQKKKFIEKLKESS